MAQGHGDPLLPALLALPALPAAQTLTFQCLKKEHMGGKTKL